MTVLQWIHVVTAASHVAIAGYSLWRGPMMLRTAAFAGFAACFAWWSACLVLAHDPSASYSQVAMAYDLSSIGWASFGSLSVTVALAFAGRGDVLSRRGVQFALIAPPIAVIAAQWRGDLASHYVHQSWGWGYAWSNSPSTIFFYAYYSVYAAIAALILLAQGRTTNRSVRAQANIVLYAGLFALFAATTTDVILPRLGIRSIPSIAPAFTLPWMFGIAIAIARYRFLELSPETVAVGLLAAMKDGVLLVDESREIVSYNPAAARLLASDCELRGRQLSRLLPEEIVAASVNAEHIHPLGDRVVAVSRSAVHDSQDRPLGSLWLLRDVTDRRRAEQALENAHAQLETRVAERTRDLGEANRELQRVIRSVGGLHAAIDAIHKAATVRDLGLGVARTLVDGLALPGSCRVMLDDEIYDCPGLASSERALDQTGQPPQRDPIVASGVTRGALELHLERALTESEQQLLTRVEQEIAQALEGFALRDAIAQSDRLASIGVLAAGIAHEINNPLTYMSLGLHDIQKRLRRSDRPDGDEIGSYANADHGSREISRRVDQVLHGCERITKIVRELTAFARDGDNIRTMRVGDAIETAVAMATHQIKHRARLIVRDEATATVQADHGRLTQVFLNLMVNAAHAIPDGNSDDHQIVVSSRDDGDHVVVAIIDTGHGIAPHDLPHVFEPFFTTKNSMGGSGLGLAISHKITRSLGGTIHAESTLGSGSTFTVRLPSSAAQTAAPSSATRPVATRWPRSTRSRILVVDDDKPVAQAIATTLEGHEVTIVGSGSEAKRMIENSAEFDVIVCDVMMPDDNGPDLHAWIEGRFGALADRIIFLTGGAFTRGTEAFLEARRSRVMFKPFDPEALTHLVAETLRRSSSSRRM